MKSLMLAMAIVALSSLVQPAFAQMTGPSVLERLREQIGTERAYNVRADADRVLMLDAATGREICMLRQVNARQMIITGTVANLSGLSADERAEAMKKIALFNFSSPVGTLWYDERTGDVCMEHKINPQLVSIPAIARVAAMFGTTVRTQTAMLAH